MFIRIFLTLLVALAVLAADLLWIGPFLSNTQGPGVGNAVYIAIRIFTVIVFAWILSRVFGRKRFSALGLTTFLVFLEHVVLKGMLVVLNPAVFGAESQGMPKDALFFGLLMSYIVSVPIVLILAFVGTEIPGPRRSTVK